VVVFKLKLQDSMQGKLSGIRRSRGDDGDGWETRAVDMAAGTNGLEPSRAPPRPIVSSTRVMSRALAKCPAAVSKGT
jgi:hypothetical protein